MKDNPAQLFVGVVVFSSLHLQIPMAPVLFFLVIDRNICKYKHASRDYLTKVKKQKIQMVKQIGVVIYGQIIKNRKKIKIKKEI